MSDPEDRVSTDDHLELLTEHLGFNPRSFIDDIVYAANENLYNLAEQYDVWARDKLREAALAAAQKAAKKTSTKKSDDLAAIESKVVLEAEKVSRAELRQSPRGLLTHRAPCPNRERMRSSRSLRTRWIMSLTYWSCSASGWSSASQSVKRGS